MSTNMTTTTFDLSILGNIKEIRITMKDDKGLDFDALINSNPDYILSDEIIAKVNREYNDWLEAGDTDIDVINAVQGDMPIPGMEPLWDESIIDGKREYRFRIIDDGSGDLWSMTTNTIRSLSVMLNNDKAYGPLGIEQVLFILCS